ncbi:Ankyrin repeat domain-containing protein 39 [Echinococcus granulosus]|uniref:Ankyrin repeat domain-containing protein 39 n=1 Tax=Echinococcus granulosus TaxID=6210 RepID=U6JCW5_ECHGR|nr:Ankyrin repeat domain-containing protein 39 [Echinococcus granulosus]EUB59692.1 Ankyrin repeat domain-containing protein 39 [Echinococcus granulosus]KAH9280257.1 Ankyrin repeat domain-containing protein 39 [Echinococcus granulosus]CDS21921.1 ankyrin repeat domain containing protein 39 [Echinococcus granulosus]
MGERHVCQIRATPCSQTLEEMDFERGPWNCAIFGETDRLLQLLGRGVEVDSRDSFGFTPLHYAAKNGKLEICKVLLAHGANVAATTRCGKATPLHRAAYSGNLSIVQLLCSHAKQNGDVSLVGMLDADGQTCLHAAARGSSSPVFHWLSNEYPELVPIRDNAGKAAGELLPQ